MQESRSIPFLKGSRAACHHTDFPQMRLDFPVCESAADGILGEDAPLGIERPSAFFQTAGGERDVRGDDDIVFLDVIDNPVISSVEPIIHDNKLDPVLPRNIHPRVAHQGHLEPMAFPDTKDFLPHGASVRIDQDFRQFPCPFWKLVLLAMPAFTLTALYHRNHGLPDDFHLDFILSVPQVGGFHQRHKGFAWIHSDLRIGFQNRFTSSSTARNILAM